MLKEIYANLYFIYQYNALPFIMKNLQRLLILLIVVSLAILVGVAKSDVNTFLTRLTRLDSIGHIIGFFLLAWFLFATLKLSTINLSICLVFYGALTEIGQVYLGFRNGEVSDFIADIIGISLFVLMRWAIMIYSNKETKTAKAAKK